MTKFVKSSLMIAAFALIVAFAGVSAKADVATFNNTGTFSGSGTNTLDLAEPGTSSGLAGRIAETPIPEPAAMLLLGTGLAGIAAKVRKRRNANKEA